MELMTPKMARFAPRQIAIVASAVIVNAGALRSWRKAKRRSENIPRLFPKVDVSRRSPHHHERSAAVDRAPQPIFVLMTVETEIAAQSPRAARRIDVYSN